MKALKKLFLVVVLLALVGFVLFSCASGTKVSAKQEYHKYFPLVYDTHPMPPYKEGDCFKDTMVTFAPPWGGVFTTSDPATVVALNGDQEIARATMPGVGLIISTGPSYQLDGVEARNTHSCRFSGYFSEDKKTEILKSLNREKVYLVNVTGSGIDVKEITFVPENPVFSEGDCARRVEFTPTAEWSGAWFTTDPTQIETNVQTFDMAGKRALVIALGQVKLNDPPENPLGVWSCLFKGSMPDAKKIELENGFFEGDNKNPILEIQVDSNGAVTSKEIPGPQP